MCDLRNREHEIYYVLQFVPTTLTLDSGVTRPPPLLSEADLLSCMDKVIKKEMLCC